jgi:hypothetical protein
MASNRPWTSVLIAGGMPELIVLTLVLGLALAKAYIPLRALKMGDYTSAERKSCNRINNQITYVALKLLTPSC